MNCNKTIMPLSKHRLFLKSSHARLPKRNLKLVQHWYSEPRRAEVLVADRRERWRFHHSPLRDVSAYPVEWLELRAQREVLLIALLDDQCCDYIGERRWWEYEDESRLLLLTLTLRYFIEGLQQLFSVDWQVSRLLKKTDIKVSEQILLGWERRVEKESGSNIAKGLMLLTPLSLRRFLNSSDWVGPNLECTYRSTSHIGLRYHLSYFVDTFQMSELSEYQLGDVMVCGRAEVVLNQMELRSEVGAGWRVSVDPLKMNTAVVKQEVKMEDDCIEINKEGETEVAKEKSSDTGEKDLGQAVMKRVGKLPIEVSIKLGTLNVPLNLLLNVQPGFVFDLPQRIDQIQAQLLANGVAIGRGELVAVGDLLGLRVTEIDVNGVE